MEAYLHGVSTRKVDDSCGRSAPTAASARPEGLGVLGLLAGRPAVPYVRRRHLLQNTSQPRVVTQAMVVATGVCGDGRREVLGFAVGDSEDGAFWTQFLRSLKARRLAGRPVSKGVVQRESNPPPSWPTSSWCALVGCRRSMSTGRRRPEMAVTEAGAGGRR